ncbi:polysaccharide biosynthesis protein [bacterium]|nr:polysaccharide biosynthesis protein [FCB group bacterium]MBL7191674.1 polysaccharide biosynthesis protein [bacterium]
MKTDFKSKFPLRLLVKVSLDIAAILMAFLVGYLIRFPLRDIPLYFSEIATYIPVFVILQIGVFAFFRLYSTMWRYSGIHVLKNLFFSATISALGMIIIAYFIGSGRIPRSILIMYWVWVIFFCGGIRLTIRHLYNRPLKGVRRSKSGQRVLIYGAGNGGELLLRNIELSGDVSVNIIGFLDDDPQKKGQYIHNKRVLGGRNKIGEIIRKYKITDIFIAIPSLSGTNAREILNTIQELAGDEVEVRKLPKLSDLVNGKVSVSQLKKFEIRDLLRRKEVHLDFSLVEQFIKGNTVLVVGGGGSIGLELCRQIACFKPAELLVLDNCEFNLYSAESELVQQYAHIKLSCIIADACNEIFMRQVFLNHKPHIVFHAAAYKHVPLMEMNPWSAVYNNLKSTLTLINLSNEFNVKKFILISTDKAVQPTSVMGATKRICELLTLLQNGASSTEYIAVRFGNVLGSSGSVIPKFKQQIASGGPVTVTHPEVSRYFMLISEAVELVLQAGAIGHNGNIYVLDMGSPIKIVDLAKYMIQLSGLKLNDDIKIEFTGLRPGEKLNETLFLEGEEGSTHIPNLFVLEPNLNINPDYISKVERLINRCYQMNHEELRSAIKELAKEYSPMNKKDIFKECVTV